jgi:hypothetical protein
MRQDTPLLTYWTASSSTSNTSTAFGAITVLSTLVEGLSEEFDDQVQAHENVRPRRLIAMPCAPGSSVCAGKDVRRERIDSFVAGQTANRVLHRRKQFEKRALGGEGVNFAELHERHLSRCASRFAVRAKSRGRFPTDAPAWSDTPWD